jgi:hypothetical protein
MLSGVVVSLASVPTPERVWKECPGRRNPDVADKKAIRHDATSAKLAAVNRRAGIF